MQPKARLFLNVLLLVALLLAGYSATVPVEQPASTAAPLPTPTSQPPRIEEIAFDSGSFHVVGDLRLPGGKGPFPLVIFVHGSGPIDRYAYGLYLPLMKRMQLAGYATFSWDKPGTGESTGAFGESTLQHQRAKIVLDAIEVMKARSEIDLRQIGLYGASQAGYVMPRVLSESQDIAFLICESCGGMPGADQMAYQVTALAACNDVPGEQSIEIERLWAELDQARGYQTYPEYLQYREALDALAKILNAPTRPWPALPEDAWQTNDPAIEGWWNPMGVMEQVKFPVLALFGDQDRQLDPLQGAIAYRRAVTLAGNPKSRVEFFSGANHALIASDSGCPEDTYVQLEKFWRSLGFETLQQVQEVVLSNPDDPRLIEGFPAVPGYLDLIEDWLVEIKSQLAFSPIGVLP